MCWAAHLPYGVAGKTLKTCGMLKVNNALFLKKNYKCNGNIFHRIELWQFWNRRYKIMAVSLLQVMFLNRSAALESLFTSQVFMYTIRLCSILQVVEQSLDKKAHIQNESLQFSSMLQESFAHHIFVALDVKTIQVQRAACTVHRASR